MEKLYEVTMQVSVKIYETSETNARIGVQTAINRGLSADYDTEVDGFYSASATEVEEVA